MRFNFHRDELFFGTLDFKSDKIPPGTFEYLRGVLDIHYRFDRKEERDSGSVIYYWIGGDDDDTEIASWVWRDSGDIVITFKCIPKLRDFHKKLFYVFLPLGGPTESEEISDEAICEIEEKVFGFQIPR